MSKNIRRSTSGSLCYPNPKRKRGARIPRSRFGLGLSQKALTIPFMIGSTHTARSHYNAVSKIPFSQRQVPKACPTTAMLFLGSVLKTLLFDGFSGFIRQDESVTLGKIENRRRSLAEWHSKVVFQDFVTIIHKAEAKHIAECFAGQLAGGR